MRRCESAPFIFSLLLGCGQPTSNDYPKPDWIAPLDIDGVQMFIPVAWNAVRPWEPRPWPNGLRIDSGGWCSHEPWMGPIEAAGRLPPGAFYRVIYPKGQPRTGSPDPCFRLTVTFEFPLRPRDDGWFASSDPGWGFPFSYDQLTFTYYAPMEDKPEPYLALLSGLKPTDGVEIGDGWREVRRTFERRPLAMRFDARDWRTNHSPLPRRLAASFDLADWAHFATVGPNRWTARFGTTRLPIAQWRSRFDTTDQLFAWLRTPTEGRAATQRFVWWTDLRYRPAK